MKKWGELGHGKVFFFVPPIFILKLKTKMFHNWRCDQDGGIWVFESVFIYNVVQLGGATIINNRL